MAIREDIVVSAVSFLQDPNVISSPIENKLSFLRSKNLTQEEIDAAFARAGGSPPPAPPATPSRAVSLPTQPRPSYPSQYQQTPPYGWQEPPPPEAPKRDWRDWFIMATVVGGVGYGLYFISKRYLYPLVAPPTPEKLDQDKTTVDEQFDKAFATLEQLAKDTEKLKEAEAARTEKLDKILDDIETFVSDSKSASRRQEDETERLREDLKNIKAKIPKSMTAHKEFTDGRLQEISNEVKSLKSLIAQRMTPAPAPTPLPGSSAYVRPASANAMSASPVTTPVTEVKENGHTNGGDNTANGTKTAPPTSVPSQQDYMSSLGGRSSPFGSAGGSAVKASIPAWQMAATSASTPGTS